MGGEQAAKVLSLVRQAQIEGRGEQFRDDDRQAFEAPIRAAYEAASHPVNAAARLWVDAIIDPAETRDWLTRALAMAAAGPRQETRFGVFRM